MLPLFSLFMVWLCLYALFLNQLAQQFDRLLHPLHGDVLIRPMEGVSRRCPGWGRGSPMKLSRAPSVPPRMGSTTGVSPTASSGLGVVDEVDVLLDDFRHVLVLILMLHSTVPAPYRSFSTLAAWSTVSFRTWNPAALWSRRQHVAPPVPRCRSSGSGDRTLRSPRCP